MTLSPTLIPTTVLDHQTFTTSDDVYKSIILQQLKQYLEKSTGKYWADFINASKSTYDTKCKYKTITLATTFHKPEGKVILYFRFRYGP